MREKLIYGVGINDAIYPVTKSKRVDGKVIRIWSCPFYDKWKNMLARCYSSRSKVNRPTYENCIVCDEWLLFSNFRAWMEQQDWKDKQLDKDLLTYKNQIYSPETCSFVSRDINQFLVKSNKSRGILPIGVSKRSVKTLTSPYRAYISNRDEFISLGDYDNPHSAHRAWQLAKINQAKELAYQQTDDQVVQGLLRVAAKIQYDYDNNLETIDF